MKVVGVGRVFVGTKPTRIILEGWECEWVAVDIFGEVCKLGFISYAHGFVAALEKGTDAFVASIKVAHIFGNYGTHKMTDTII